ncbi:hypothetical protein BT69DRAFT_1279795 [Atractiella rhizophila]|nr:hypothetical protein BT69DRAFT_1279795 [Atractiella rhizophila]
MSSSQSSRPSYFHFNESDGKFICNHCSCSFETGQDFDDHVAEAITYFGAQERCSYYFREIDQEVMDAMTPAAWQKVDRMRHEARSASSRSDRTSRQASRPTNNQPSTPRTPRPPVPAPSSARPRAVRSFAREEEPHDPIKARLQRELQQALIDRDYARASAVKDALDFRKEEVRREERINEQRRSDRRDERRRDGMRRTGDGYYPPPVDPYWQTALQTYGPPPLRPRRRFAGPRAFGY